MDEELRDHQRDDRPQWFCDVCEGATFASALEKARHFVSKRHALCMDNWQKAERASAGAAGVDGGGNDEERRRARKEDAERAKALAALLKDERAAANALHARLEAQLVRLQLLDEALNTCERLRWQQLGSATQPSNLPADQEQAVVVGFEDRDDERGPWSAAKQKVFMQRIYDVVAAHGIQPDQVMNVYRWGSRWWGHHSPRSDYDFVVLVRDWNQPSTQNVLQEDDIDLAVYEVNIFQQLINQHVCVFMSYPPDGILLERHKLHWDYRANKFLSGVRKNMFKNYNIAKQYWQYGEIKRSKKRFIYVVKHWALSLQMANTQTITDRHVLNDVTQTLMRTHFPNWNAFHQWYRSYGEKAEAAIKEVTQAFKQFELDWWATKDSRRGSHLAVVDYIARHGFDELIKNLDINVELMDAGGTTASVGKGIGKVLAASKDAQLVVLSSEKIGSPASSRITFECTSALVLARSSDGAAWRPVAQAFPRYRRLYPFPGSDKKRVEEDEVWAIIKAKQVGIEDLSDVNWASAEAREVIDGHLGVLFYHGGKWLVHIKTRRTTQQADLVSEFWRLYAAQGITDQSLNTSWCYIFQLVSSRYPRDMKYRDDALVLVGVRDTSAPLCPEINLNLALGGQPAATFQSCHQDNHNESDDATAAHIGWLVPRRFQLLHDQAAMERKVRRQSPLSFKGLVISDRAPQPAAAAPALSASSCRRVVMSSPAYLWLAKLRALETWELEGDWDDEEGADGEIDFPMERERCLFELVLLFMQWRSRQHTRTRRGDKGKWKRLRRERRATTEAQTPSEDQATSSSTTDDRVQEHEEDEILAEDQIEGEEQQEPQRDREEERFLELHEDYREAYLAVKTTFLETCRQIDLCYTQLNQRCPLMKDWARECEKERYKPLLFVLKKRDFPSTLSFFTDYESMHEPRVEKVSYYILDYMHELTRQGGPRLPTPPPGPSKPLYRWQG